MFISRDQERRGMFINQAMKILPRTLDEVDLQNKLRSILT